MKKIALGIITSAICALNINAYNTGTDVSILEESSTLEYSIDKIPNCPKTLLLNYEPNIHNTKDTIVISKQQELCKKGEDIVFSAITKAFHAGKKVEKKEYEEYIKNYPDDVIKNVEDEYSNNIEETISIRFSNDEWKPYTLIKTIDAKNNIAIAYIKKQKDKDDEYYIVVHKQIKESLKYR